MVSISLCMIVKNEEDVLSRCLDSIKDLVDEIIVVDTGSEDRTVEIAEEYTQNVYHFTWIEDFAKARNYAFSKATMEFVMWLDADDILLEEDRDKFRRLKENLDSRSDMVMMKYNVAFDMQGRPTFSYNRERIMRREAGYHWVGAIHEIIQPSGNIIYSDACVTHKKLHPTDPDRNLNIFKKLLSEGHELDARQQFYYARELSYHKCFEEAIEVLEEFLKDGKGWIENNINACIDLAGFYRSTFQNEKILPTLCRSFAYDEPRAEVCCEIGRYFYELKQYRQAIFWYDIAGTRHREVNSSGFQSEDCYGFIPYMQLCVCYDRIGDKNMAEEYHKKARALKPDDPGVLYNENYFNTLRAAPAK